MELLNATIAGIHCQARMRVKQERLATVGPDYEDAEIPGRRWWEGRAEFPMDTELPDGLPGPFEYEGPIIDEDGRLRRCKGLVYFKDYVGLLESTSYDSEWVELLKGEPISVNIIGTKAPTYLD